MSAGMEIAAIGLRAQQQALDSIAGNVTNINTPTYKRSDLRFSELLVTPSSGGNDGISAVSVSTRPAVDQQGQLQATGNSLDLAINGNGFIELMGSGGRTMLWRGGTLQVQDDGTLATSSGYQLKASVTVPKGASNLTINPDGKVYATSSGSAAPTQIGQINLVDMSGSAAIQRLDGGIYQVTDGSQLSEAAPGEDNLGNLVQGEQEQSNVDLNTEMVNLLISQRAYAASAQVVQAADQLYSLANSIRR
ncbi:flagellar hook basal-body protein [Telmatospirillum sp.]|uniref:flagellar hook-basal body protein n=1 Tax=Telmatospirillum sp. TaxID=2079197 RepID=UPI00283FB18B|nr:flagellar hook basal-body protein [Telmatospirillum sp.]MDR3438096.1 flagellar hook basal-body protein [Telmatospirillum sp.]